MIETSSPIHSESLARYSPEESMWRTSPDSQLSLKMDDQATSQKSLVDFPRSGMTVGGTLYPLKTQAHRTCVNGGGSLPNFPTPQAMDAVTRSNESFHRIMDRPRQGKMLPKLAYIIHVAPKWNTPNTMDSLPPRSEKALKKQYEKNRKGRKEHSTLREQVVYPKPEKMWPTPTVNDSKNNGGPSQHRRTTIALNAKVGGALNPQWVEWLIGYPIGWTDLKD